MSLAPHQQRVVDERDQLAERIEKLDAFIQGNSFFEGLPEAEQERLVAQAGVMAVYCRILERRIGAF